MLSKILHAYETRIAFRYLRAKRKQTFISLVTLTSSFSVMLGVMSLIIVLAMMTGFHEELRDKILGSNAHIVIYNTFLRDFSDYESVIERCRHHPDVEAAAPFIYRKVMIKFQSVNDGILVKGIDPKRSVNVVDLQEDITKGSLEDLKPDEDGLPGIIVGWELAANLGLLLGDELKIIAPNEIQTPMGPVHKTKHFRVAGIFDSGMYDYDSTWAYISISEAQKLFNLEDRVSGVELKLKEIFKAEEIAQELDGIFQGRFVCRDWMTMNSELYSALKLEKMVSFIFIILIIVVAAFGIGSTLTLMVMDKYKDIGILKALGATSKSLMLIFIMEGLFIGLIGTVVGAFLGGVTCYVLDTYKLIQLSGDVYFITFVPFRMKVIDFVLTCSVSMLICLLVTIYPSRCAAKLEPVEAIRYE